MAKQKYKFLIVPLLFAAMTFASLSQARILSDDEVSSADIESLKTESVLFETLQKGIALSLSECEQMACTPSVRKPELQRLVDALGIRISSLGVRYQESQEPELENILISYVDSQEVYSKFIEKLGTIAPELDVEDSGLAEEEDIFADQFGSLPNIMQQYSIFEDIDDEIEDEIEDGEDLEILDEETPPE